MSRPNLMGWFSFTGKTGLVSNLQRVAFRDLYIAIERDMPGAGNLPEEQLQGISQKSCCVLAEMGPKIQWVHSYVTGDKGYSTYKAPNADMVREHAERGGFTAIPGKTGCPGIRTLSGFGCHCQRGPMHLSM